MKASYYFEAYRANELASSKLDVGNDKALFAIFIIVVNK